MFSVSVSASQSFDVAENATWPILLKLDHRQEKAIGLAAILWPSHRRQPCASPPSFDAQLVCLFR
jgi:hypothetical protein